MNESECQNCNEWETGYGCINGTRYGFCSSEDCYGMCEDLGQCGCECHGGLKAAAVPEPIKPKSVQPSNFHPPFPLYDAITLDRQRYFVQQSVNLGAFSSSTMEREQFEEDLWNRMTYRLSADILAERLPNVTESETQTFSIETPATWFQHLKQTCYRWRRLDWLARRWPARLETVEKECTLTVNLERYRTYPEADIVLPPDRYGYPVKVAVARKDWLWNDSL